MASIEIPTMVLPNSCGEQRVPVIGMGSAPDFTCKKDTKEAVIEAIKQGYRHFDTAAAYGSEQALGEALNQAIHLRLVTRQQLFVTSKLWVTDNHPHLVLSALRKSLRSLQLEYLDLYLIHWPLSSQPGKFSFPIEVEDLLPFDMKGVWEAMEECQKLGLTRAIGVSNFSVKKLQNLLSVATIPPAVNQVEMNLAWQQKKLREFCKANGIVITAFSPLRKGASRGKNEVMENDMLKEIAESHGKSIAQVSLRWLYEEGVTFVPKSYDKERMNQNLHIFDWALTKEDHHKINQIYQSRLIGGPTKPQLSDLWDDEI
ncbi:NAD(P)H-dependent 6'-deoxychalcone synthase [Cajanus cajan]|uniref:NAD(P)H-dependent 6'-deoxychalcone synthase n=1 Tax=Cajanus cajan TaxID=3821 RepID=A0A151S008_CAJCA|nr:NAD(P)H-dependent 6'-deoxychalcone synthase [Cajanus cajan]KYP48132.1 NAD(P)H-dependent 6'-deoxychalcone synthase [Cajanus cajan]